MVSPPLLVEKPISQAVQKGQDTRQPCGSCSDAY